MYLSVLSLPPPSEVRIPNSMPEQGDQVEEEEEEDHAVPPKTDIIKACSRSQTPSRALQPRTKDS